MAVISLKLALSDEMLSPVSSPIVPAIGLLIARPHWIGVYIVLSSKHSGRRLGMFWKTNIFIFIVYSFGGGEYDDYIKTESSAVESFDAMWYF